MESLRSKFHKWLYTSCPGFAGRFPYYGTQLYFPKDSVIFKWACREGGYEKANLSLLKLLVKPNSFYFDVGANIGVMSVPILEYNSFCSVLSFEPSPLAFSCLKHSMENSPYKDRWKVVDKAAGTQEGFAEFFTSGSGYDAYSGFQNTERYDTCIKIKVPVTTLDTEWEILGKPALSVIKIDVEGAEIQVIEGAFQCIENEKPYIFVEWNLANLKAYQSSSNELLRIADQIGYRVYSVLANYTNTPPFNIFPILDEEDLKLQMMTTESFLLAPSNQHQI